MKTRSQQKELMDLGPSYYTAAEYADCLFQLERIGQLLGGDNASLRAFDQLKYPPRTILDVGCGGGAFARRLAQRYPKADVLGIDISSEAIHYAQQMLKKMPMPNLQFQCRANPHLDNSLGTFDIVTSTLVSHHLSDNELIQFLQEMYARASQAVIINDLHRHPLALASFAIAARLFFRNRLILHDGLLSIRRAFIRKEWLSYLHAAGLPIHCYSIKWRWAFRWVITISKELGSVHGRYE